MLGAPSQLAFVCEKQRRWHTLGWGGVAAAGTAAAVGTEGATATTAAGCAELGGLFIMKSIACCRPTRTW